jgi:hypothetical protein
LLPDDKLIVEVRRLSAINQRLPTLLLLVHLEPPVQPRDIVEKAHAIGFRKIREWNVGSILHKAANANLVVQRADGWRMLDLGWVELNNAGVDLNRKVSIPPSDSVLPRELFEGTRGYLERVAAQINASYDFELFDCCAVMCRRLAETLIIEVYEHQNRANEIIGQDGNFHMLNGLLAVMLGDRTVNLGRNSKRGLEALKELGDRSAHNRRFNARKSDIDRMQTGLRTSAEELINLSGLAR